MLARKRSIAINIEPIMPIPEIESTGNIVSNAFHGTSLPNAKMIEEGQYRVGRDTDLLLGDGVYFYVGSYREAYKFAKQIRRNEDAVVLRSRIELRRCLDLDSREHRELIELVEEELLESRIYDRVPLPFAINYLAQLAFIDTVKKTVVTDPRPVSFPSSRVYSYTKTMIAVRNVVSITHTSIEPQPES